MIRIVLIDDHQLFREALSSMLENEPNIKVVGQAGDGDQAIDLIAETQPHVLLLDIEMPKVDGFMVIKQLQKLKLPLKVLALTMHDSGAFVKNIIAAGADGYLKKDVDKKTLLFAINEVYISGSYYPKETTQLVIESLKEKNRETTITPREKEVIMLIAEGLTTKEIASKLFLSKHTIESHRQNILLKLGLKNSAELVKYAMKKGWG